MYTSQSGRPHPNVYLVAFRRSRRFKTKNLLGIGDVILKLLRYGTPQSLHALRVIRLWVLLVAHISADLDAGHKGR